MENINLLSIIAIAFLGSFGHCIGMCGGVVLAYSGAKISPQDAMLSKIVSHLSYSFGRVSTYTFIGAIFGYLGSVATLNNIAYATLLFIAGFFMILSGLSLMGKLEFLTKLEHPLSSFYQDSFKKLLYSKSLGSFFLLGMLNGLLPCGFVYFFAISAASSASMLGGALVMFAFGVSTIPALFAFGFFASLFSSGKFRKLMMNLSSFAIILYGIFTLYNGYTYIANQNKTLLECHGS